MHDFENGTEPTTGRPARQRRQVKRESDEVMTRRAGLSGLSWLAGLGGEYLTPQLGRADRHPSAEAAGTRNLPGLIGRGPARARSGSVRSRSPMRVPLPRSPLDGRLLDDHLLDGHLEADAQVLSLNGHSPVPAGRGTSYRQVADGLAIAPKVTVVLPVMNEAANLPGVFASLPGWVHEVVLVDGRSSDGSIDVARRLRPDIKVVLQGGAGKGDALAAGFSAATGDIIVAIDADGSTDGQEIPRFVSALLAGADFVKGSRFSSAGGSDDITVVRRYGNKMLKITVNQLFGTSFSDLCYGYNAFWSRHLGELAVDSPGFEVETLLSIRAAQAGLKIHEVPSHERLRQNGTSNLSALKDGWRVLRLITQEKRVSKRRKAGRPKPFMAPGRLINEENPPEAGYDDHGQDELPRDVRFRPGWQAGQ
jgi:hypothetical protein